MRKWMFFLLAIGVVLQSYAQKNDYVVTGKVTEQGTGQPLAGASVFAQNTTLGTVTNAAGEFRLQVPNGGYDLVVSYTGYETNSIRISNSSSSEPLSIELKKQDKTMQEVAVVGSTEIADGWEKYGKVFIENFIGTTPNSALCTLENKEALRFFFSKKKNRLKILTREDLVITNKALGYKIRYQLDSFTYEYNTEIITFSGYPRFEELTGTDAEKITWENNRTKAYYGSRMHFMRSWHNSALKDAGYSLEQITDMKSIAGEPISNPYDSSIYLVDSTDTEINLTGRIRVLFRGELPEPTYISQNRLSPYLKVQISTIDVANPFVIEENGYFYEQADVINAGYWAWEKIAESLPYDYWPK